MKKQYIPTVLCLLLAGCGTGEYPKDLGSGYTIDYDGSGYFAIYKNRNHYAVTGEVTAHQYDENFVVAKRKPFRHIMDSMTSDPSREYRYPDYQRAIAESRHFDYWLVDKVADSVIGPLTKSAYDSAHKAMKIPDSLRVD